MGEENRLMGTAYKDRLRKELWGRLVGDRVALSSSLVLWFFLFACPFPLQLLRIPLGCPLGRRRKEPLDESHLGAKRI